jgi:tetratricopeptide (TPR) repeat protein
VDVNDFYATRDADIEAAIRQKNIDALMNRMFEPRSTELRFGFKTETDLWDYKKDCPRISKDYNPWADLAKDVLAFHNHKGGVIVFGITDGFEFEGCTTTIDSKRLNDQLRRFISDRLWVEYHREFIQRDQRYLGVALVAPAGPRLERFISDAPQVNGRALFKKGDSAIRKGDSSFILTRTEADQLELSRAAPSVGDAYYINEGQYRVLAPDFVQFVPRDEPCAEIERTLNDKRVSIASLIGIGGVGKTTLATWATKRAYDRRQFKYIVSLTAKDRELTKSGIVALSPGLTSFESLLDAILEVFDFPELRAHDLALKESEVRTLLESESVLLFVDNLETVDDTRIIGFLDNLPEGVKAITTSRRTSVRVSVRPIEIGPLTEDEAIRFIESLASAQLHLKYILKLSKSQKNAIAVACDRIPLAIRWVLSRSRTPSDTMALIRDLRTPGRQSEELLEFCFRRVFDSLNAAQQHVLEVLSLFQAPLTREAVSVGCGALSGTQDAIDAMVEDALVHRQFDPDQNDYSYTLIPITRSFVYKEVAKHSGLEERIRRRLVNWYEAKDVGDPEERLIVRELRQRRDATDANLLSLAQSAERRGKADTAEKLYERALNRNPRSWRSAKAYAEFQRHVRENTARCLQLYEQAAANAPSKGRDRALIFRERGMVLRNAGHPTATDEALESFLIALEANPDDILAAHGAATMYERKGMDLRVVELMEPLADHPYQETRKRALDLLVRAYTRRHDVIKANAYQEALSAIESPEPSLFQVTRS